MSNNTQLSDQAIRWIQNEGFSIHIELFPKINALQLPGSSIGSPDASKVQVAGSVRSKKESKNMSSELVDHTREEVESILDEQFQAMKQEALGKHFGSVSTEERDKDHGSPSTGDDPK